MDMQIDRHTYVCIYKHTDSMIVSLSIIQQYKCMYTHSHTCTITPPHYFLLLLLLYIDIHSMQVHTYICMDIHSHTFKCSLDIKRTGATKSPTDADYTESNGQLFGKPKQSYYTHSHVHVYHYIVYRYCFCYILFTTHSCYTFTHTYGHSHAQSSKARNTNTVYK